MLIVLTCAGCASQSGAWSKQLIAGRDITGVAKKTYSDKLWTFAQGYAQGDLADVEHFYNPVRIDDVDRTLMGMIAAVRLPKDLEGWVQQAKHFGITITGFAGVLHRGSVDKKAQAQFVADMGMDRPWPEYQLPYTTSAAHVFAIIEKGQLTPLACEIRPLNPTPGPVDEYGSYWLSKETPNPVEVLSFVQIKKRRLDEMPNTLPWAKGTDVHMHAGDTSELALEKALRPACIGRGPWHEPPASDVRHGAW